jgi:hypothetical protein
MINLHQRCLAFLGGSFCFALATQGTKLFAPARKQSTKVKPIQLSLVTFAIKAMRRRRPNCVNFCVDHQGYLCELRVSGPTRAFEERALPDGPDHNRMRGSIPLASNSATSGDDHLVRVALFQTAWRHRRSDLIASAAARLFVS